MPLCGESFTTHRLDFYNRKGSPLALAALRKCYFDVGQIVER